PGVLSTRVGPVEFVHQTPQIALSQTTIPVPPEILMLNLTSQVLLLPCVLDKYNVTRLDTSTEDQLFGVRGPVETEHVNPLEMGNLVQRAIVQPEAPNVVAVLSTIDVCQLVSVRTPANTGR